MTEHHPNAADPADPTDVDLLVELEHEGWQALCTGGGAGADFYGGLMAPDAVMVLGNGEVMSRSEVLSSLRDAPPWDTYTIDAPAVVAISDDVHAVVYSATGRRGGNEFRGVMTSTYVRTPDGWQLAFHQQTPAG